MSKIKNIKVKQADGTYVDVPLGVDLANVDGLEDKTAASGGTDVSLVTTGDKYIWNSKSDLSKIETSITLAVANWNNKSQTVTVNDVTSSCAVVVTPTPASIDDWSECGVLCTTQATNSLTFSCDETPEVAISVNIMIIK